MLVQVYRKVIQLRIYIYIFRLFLLVGYYKILSIVSVLYSRALLFTYFIYSSVFMWGFLLTFLKFIINLFNFIYSFYLCWSSPWCAGFPCNAQVSCCRAQSLELVGFRSCGQWALERGLCS